MEKPQILAGVSGVEQKSDYSTAFQARSNAELWNLSFELGNFTAS